MGATGIVIGSPNSSVAIYGNKVIIGTNAGIYSSSNGGISLTVGTGPLYCNVAIGSSGSIACNNNGIWYDLGSTGNWVSSPSTTGMAWESIAISGNNAIAVLYLPSTTSIYYSQNAGVTWATGASWQTSNQCYCAISGNNAVIAQVDDYLYYSANIGQTVTPSNVGGFSSNYTGISISGNIAVVSRQFGEGLWSSYDNGQNWLVSPSTTSPAWSGISISNGNAVSIGDGIVYYSSITGPAPSHTCLLSTSSILTPLGYKSITDIKTGDQVVSAMTNSPVNVLHCGYNVVDLETIEKTNLPLCIPKNHFVDSMPNKDVLLSGHHSVVFSVPDSNNYVGVQAFKLYDFVKLSTSDVLKATGLDDVRYYHIVVEGDKKNVVKCDGLPVETLVVEDWNNSFVENL